MSIYMKFFVSVDIINSMSIDTINFMYILNNPHVYMLVYIDIIILRSDYNCAGIRAAWADDDICRFVTPRDDARS